MEVVLPKKETADGGRGSRFLTCVIVACMGGDTSEEHKHSLCPEQDNKHTGLERRNRAMLRTTPNFLLIIKIRDQVNS